MPPIFFEKFAGYENVFLAEEEGQVIASLCAVPVTLQGRKGADYYGVCTRPERRGKGVMTELMDYARSQLLLRGWRLRGAHPRQCQPV